MRHNYCILHVIYVCIILVFADSEDGEAVSVPDNTNEETSTEEMPKEREASSNSTGMNEWSGERWDTVTDVGS